MKFLTVTFLVLVVLAVIFSFADIGGNIILGLAKSYLVDNYKLVLNAESISGNPIKGYTLNNFDIQDEHGQQILMAGFLSGRASFPALFRGKIRLAEITLGGLDMNIDEFMNTLQNLNIPDDSDNNSNISSSSVNPEVQQEIPVERVSLRESNFTSKFGAIYVNEIGADLTTFDIDLDGKINGIPISGTIDMGEDAGFTAVNRSAINFGSGKITATGGLINDNLDIHASVENLDLQEITALYPEMLDSRDFEGGANFNVDLTGKIDNPRISGAVNYNGTKIYGFPVERISANVNYSDNRLTVNNIQASAFNIPVQGELAVANRPGEVTSIMVKLDGSEANLDGLDKILKLAELRGLSGKVSSFSANISGPVNSLSGLVNFNAPRIAYNGRALTNIRAQMKLAKSDTAHVDGKFSFENSQGYLQGNIASFLTGPVLNLTAKIVDLDVKRVQNMIPNASDYNLAGKITASVTVKGSVSNPMLSGSLSSPEFSGMGQRITKPVINFAFTNKTLTLTKTEGSLNGMPISITGTIGPLPSSNPNMNINATIAVSPASLKNYVPDINNYALKGNINAGIKITGSVNNPNINLLASSSNLQAMNMITARDIEITTALNGDLTKLDKLSLNAVAKIITASGMTFSNVNAKLDKLSDKIILGGFNAQSGAGNITGAGTASVSGKSPLDFNFRFTNLSLAQLASGFDMKGNLSGTLKVSGANTNPAIALNANIPSLNAQGLSLNNMLADISGNMQKLTLNKLRADVEGNELNATGNIQITPAIKLSVALNGNNIKLERLLREYPGLKDNLSGNVNLTFNISGNEKNISGHGSLTSGALKAFGISMTNINLPLSYSGNSFSSTNGSAKLYSGNVKNTFTLDINAMKFTNNLEVSGVNVNSLIQDVSGGLDGKITGTGKLTMKINGTAKTNVTYSGTGNFSMGSGSITGFKWLDIITRIHGTNGINYASVNAPLTLQTGKLILRTGSIANANKNDPMYKYAKLTQNGTVDFSGSDITLNFMTESSINYQLINAIQGGSKGGLEALFKGGVSSWRDGLKTFLTGGLEGAGKSGSTGDFRTVTLKISGRANSPSLSSLKIGPSTLKADDGNKNTPSNNNNQQDFTNRVIDRAINIVTGKNDNTNSTQNTPRVTTPAKINTPANTNTNQTNTTQDIKDKLKEELRKGIKKGLGGLLKK